MSTDAGTTTATTDAAGTGQPAGQQTPQFQAPPAQDEKPNIEGWLDGKTPELTTENAGRVIAAIREDFKAERAKLRQGAAAQEAAQEAAKKAQADAVRQMAKAAGLDFPGDEPDPAKLVAELEAKERTIRELTIRSALTDAMHANSAKPIARAAILGDEVLKDLDPSADDFTSKVDEAVKAYIEKNPELKAARAAGRSAADHAGGSGEDSDPASKAQPGQARLAAAYANSGS